MKCGVMWTVAVMEPRKNVIEKIVSGGQEGVDEEAVAAAIEFGVPVSGTSPYLAGAFAPLRKKVIHARLKPVPVYIVGHPYEKFRYRTTRNVELCQCVILIHSELRRVSPAALSLIHFLKKGSWYDESNRNTRMWLEKPVGSKHFSIEYYPHGFRHLVVMTRVPRTQDEVTKSLLELWGYFEFHKISSVYFFGSSVITERERVYLQFFFRCFFIYNTTNTT